MAPSLSPHPFTSGPCPENNQTVGTPIPQDRQSIITAIYILYALGFFFYITALVGFILAYAYGRDETGTSKQHFEFQKGIFKVGFFLMIFMSIAIFVVGIIFAATMSEAEMPTTGGLIFLFSLVTLVALSLYWFVWTILTIVFGFKALSNNLPPTSETILLISPLPSKYRKR